MYKKFIIYKMRRGETMELKGVKNVIIAKALGVSQNTICRWKKQGILEKKIEEYHKEALILRDFEAFREMKAKSKEAKAKKLMGLSFSKKGEKNG